MATKTPKKDEKETIQVQVPETPETEAEVHDLKEEREKRSNLLVRGLKKVGRGVKNVKDATVRGIDRTLNGAVNQVKKHPVIATTVVAAGAGYGVKKARDKSREERREEHAVLSQEMAETHALQHDQLVDELTHRGISESVKDAVEEQDLRGSVFAAVNSAFKRQQAGNGQKVEAKS